MLLVFFSFVRTCVCVFLLLFSPSIFFVIFRETGRATMAGYDHDEFSNLRFIGDRLRANAK